MCSEQECLLLKHNSKKVVSYIWHFNISNFINPQYKKKNSAGHLSVTLQPGKHFLIKRTAIQFTAVWFVVIWFTFFSICLEMIGETFVAKFITGKNDMLFLTVDTFDYFLRTVDLNSDEGKGFLLMQKFPSNIFPPDEHTASTLSFSLKGKNDWFVLFQVLILLMNFFQFSLFRSVGVSLRTCRLRKVL